MSDFRATMKNKDRELKKQLPMPSLPPLKPYSSHGRQVLGNACGRHISKKVNVDIRADLTFRQAIDVMSAPVLGVQKTQERIFINEGYAILNITAFLNRLNYACFKHAYKRYGKRLEVFSCIHGGDVDLREGVPQSDMDKRLHTHILLELPNHFDFATFKLLIEKSWKGTSWGYDVNYIEQIHSHFGSARYNAGFTQDSIDYQNTNFANEVPCN